MGQRLAALVVVGVFGLSLPLAAEDQSGNQPTIRKVLAFFEGHGDETIDAFLMRLRPAPLDEASRAAVIVSLPKSGEVRPSAKDVVKLSAARRILDYGARPGTITVKVIDVDSAFVGLYHRGAVLISSKALALLDADELAALVAHEKGHDVDWNDYWSAMQAQDQQRMRELELKADGLAVLTLELCGISPERLAAAVQKTIRYNNWLDHNAGVADRPFATGDARRRYVALKDRAAFIRAVASLKWAEAPPRAANVR